MSGDSDGQYKCLFLISKFVYVYQQDVRENPSALWAHEEHELLAISGYETGQEEVIHRGVL